MPGHSAQLGNILGMNYIRLYDDWFGVLLNGLLGELDPIIDDEQRIVASENLVVEGDSVQVLFENRLEHLVVFFESLFLLVDG